MAILADFQWLHRKNIITVNDEVRGHLMKGRVGAESLDLACACA